MTAGKIIGLGLMALGAIGASSAWILLLFERDSSTLPIQFGLLSGIGWTMAGVVEVQVGLRMTRMAA